MKYQYKNQKGQFSEAPLFVHFISWLTIIGYFSWCLFAFVVHKPISMVQAQTISDCHKVSEGNWDCSEASVLEKWKQYEVSKPKPQEKKTAYHTNFSKRHSKSQDKVATRIVQIAKENGVKNIPYFLALADCESSFIPSNSNSIGNTPKNSIDRGTWMFNSRWHPDVSNTCAYDLDCSTRMAIKKLKTGTRWVCQSIIEKEEKTIGRISFYKKYIK